MKDGMPEPGDNSSSKPIKITTIDDIGPGDIDLLSKPNCVKKDATPTNPKSNDKERPKRDSRDKGDSL